MKILVLIASCFTQHIHTQVVYKESPWHYLNTEIKTTSFGDLKAIYIYIYNHHSSKPGQIAA